jgi:thymidylate synthase (FAD)
MKAELIDYMGTDLTVVNAARVSFDKESEWEIETDPHHGGKIPPYNRLSDKDKKLINYLAKHDHYTPFTHCAITLRETVPIFVARQRFKHTVGFSYNEVSRRYVDDEPEFFIPAKWRKRAEDKKQGSSDEEIEEKQMAKLEYKVAIKLALNTYEHLLEIGVAPEQARMVLPQSMYTSYYVTGSLAAWARAYKLRSDKNSQAEISELAEMWSDTIKPLFPHSWEALTNDTGLR